MPRRRRHAPKNAITLAECQEYISPLSTSSNTGLITLHAIYLAEIRNEGSTIAPCRYSGLGVERARLPTYLKDMGHLYQTSCLGRQGRKYDLPSTRFLFPCSRFSVVFQSVRIQGRLQGMMYGP